MERTGVLVRNFEKNPKRYQDPVLWAWLEFFCHPQEVPIDHFTVVCSVTWPRLLQARLEYRSFSVLVPSLMKCLLVLGLHESEISFVSADFNLQLAMSMHCQHWSLVSYK